MRTAKLAFLLAALAAAAVLLPLSRDIATHARDLIFGFFGLQIFAFLVHALPRWTGRPFWPARAPDICLALHAIALVWWMADPEGGFAFRVLALLTGATFLVAHSIRAHAPAAILASGFVLLHALGSVLVLAPDVAPVDGLRLGLAALVLFCLDVSTRIVAALNIVARERRGLAAVRVPAAALVLVMKASCGVTMTLWAVDGPFAIPALASGVVGLVWLIRLRPLATAWTVGMAPLFLGLFAMRAGSVLMGAIGMGWLDLPASVAVHVWTVGGLALLAIAISGSIARRQARTAFVFSPVAALATFAIVTAALVRLGAGLLPDLSIGLLDGARLLWALAFAASFAFIAASPDRRADGIAANRPDAA